MEITVCIIMNVEETIKNIVDNCDNYIDPDLVAIIINDNYTLGSNNFSEIDDFGICQDDIYEKRLMKILEHKNIFIICGIISFIPILNECDIYSIEDETFKINSNEYEETLKNDEYYFGFLIKNNMDDYIIGTVDLCTCNINSKFREVKKSKKELYNKLKDIIEKKFIF